MSLKKQVNAINDENISKLMDLLKENDNDVKKVLAPSKKQLEEIDALIASKQLKSDYWETEIDYSKGRERDNKNLTVRQLKANLTKYRDKVRKGKGVAVASEKVRVAKKKGLAKQNIDEAKKELEEKQKKIEQEKENFNKAAIVLQTVLKNLDVKKEIKNRNPYRNGYDQGYANAVEDKYGGEEYDEVSDGNFGYEEETNIQLARIGFKAGYRKGFEVTDFYEYTYSQGYKEGYIQGKNYVNEAGYRPIDKPEFKVNMATLEGTDVEGAYEEGFNDGVNEGIEDAGGEEERNKNIKEWEEAREEEDMKQKEKFIKDLLFLAADKAVEEGELNRKEEKRLSEKKLDDESRLYEDYYEFGQMAKKNDIDPETDEDNPRNEDDPDDYEIKQRAYDAGYSDPIFPSDVDLPSDIDEFVVDHDDDDMFGDDEHDEGYEKGMDYGEKIGSQGKYFNISLIKIWPKITDKSELYKQGFIHGMEAGEMEAELDDKRDEQFEEGRGEGEEDGEYAKEQGLLYYEHYYNSITKFYKKGKSYLEGYDEGYKEGYDEAEEL
jgi:hypothetical protein